MKYRMLNYKSLFSFAVTIFVVGATALIVPSLGSNGVAHAQAEFTNESFQGNYAFKSVSGANDGAGLGVLIADGDGNFLSGSTIFNAPAPIRKRQVITATVDGTYTVNANGTGIAAFTFTPDVGPTEVINLDLVIFEAEVVGDVKLATEVFGIEREPINPLLGRPGSLVTVLIKRLPD